MSRLCGVLISYKLRLVIIVYRQRIIDLLKTKRVGVHLGLEKTYIPIKYLQVV